MIAIELDEEREGIEIFVDEQGIDEMQRYLQFIRAKKDHMHLLAGGELSEILVNSQNERIKHAKLIYCED